MSTNFRLIPKFYGNCLVILFEANGEVRNIAQICLPADHQTIDDVSTANDICQILKKRIRKSL